MVGVKRMEWNFGYYRIVGDNNGERMEILGNLLIEILNRMKRGVDESAIESMAEAADPVIYSKSSGEFIEIS